MVVVVVRFEEFNLKFYKVRDPHSTTAGATTAEKLEGTSDGVDPFLFFPRCSPSPIIVPPMFHPFLLFFPPLLNSAERSEEAL